MGALSSLCHRSDNKVCVIPFAEGAHLAPTSVLASLSQGNASQHRPPCRSIRIRYHLLKHRGLCKGRILVFHSHRGDRSKMLLENAAPAILWSFRAADIIEHCVSRENEIGCYQHPPYPISLCMVSGLGFPSGAGPPRLLLPPGYTSGTGWRWVRRGIRLGCALA